MELVVEDGTGVVTANAYATVGEIDEILSYQIHTTGWDALDVETKAKLIIWASQILDQRVKWFGCITHESQGMGWPRTGTRNRENVPIDDSVVPLPVKQATAIMANHFIEFNPNEANDSNNVTMIQADSVVLRFDPYADVYDFPPSISPILKNIGRTGLGGGGPKRIVKY